MNHFVKSVIIFALICASSSSTFSSNDNLPCRYQDSINITEGRTSDDQVVSHDGVFYNPNMYGTINYVYLNNSKDKQIVPPYIRGCLCSLKPCVRICCPGGVCSSYSSLTVKTSSSRNTTSPLSKTGEYGFQYENPCSHMHLLEPDEDEEDDWIFLKDGKLSVGNGRSPKIYTKDQYCIFSMTENQKLVDVAVCYDAINNMDNIFNPIGMMFSVPFLLLTLFIYMYFPELRITTGKCLCFYILGLSVGYSALAAADIRLIPENAACASVGYLIYFSFMLSFFWLNIISLDVWWTLRQWFPEENEKRKFFCYVVYGCGLPIALLTLAITADQLNFIPKHLTPRFGETRCWITNDEYMEFLYFYLVIIILIFMNIVFFISTALKIVRSKNEVRLQRSADDQFNNNKTRFWLYLRLFIMMGIAWSLEIVSWIFQDSGVAFYISDFCNCVQGVFIFVLFVWKQPKVVELIKKELKLGTQNLPKEHSSSGSAVIISYKENNTKY